MNATSAASIALTLALAVGTSTTGRSTPETLTQGTPTDGVLRVSIVGSGGGPTVNVRRFGPSTLIEAGGEVLLFDCGRGASIRLTEMNVPLDRVNKVFLTHLHSDHIVDLPDLYLTPWSSPAARTVPFEVWGPEGTRSMMEHLQAAFAFDIHTRRDVDEKYSRNGIRVEAHDIAEGTVLDRNGVKVTAFLVDHGPVKPAFGYRIDYRGRSVALSGDTRFSENLIKFATGVDVLIHEAIDADVSRARLAAGTTNQTREQIENVIAHHTTPQEAGEVFRRVGPRLAVYSHAGNSENLITRTRERYTGALESGIDKMRIEIGETIRIQRPE